MLSIWEIETHNDKSHDVHSILKLAVDQYGIRLPIVEKHAEIFYQKPSGDPSGNNLTLLPKLESVMEHELKYRGIVKDKQSYSAKLIG